MAIHTAGGFTKIILHYAIYNITTQTVKYYAM